MVGCHRAGFPDGLGNEVHTERVGAGGHLLIKVGIGALASVLSPVSAFAVQKAFMVL